MDKRNVYILGSKGIPAAYGGFETFVERLTAGKVSEKLHYYVSCQKYADEYAALKGECYEHNGATCFPIKVPKIDAFKSVYCDAVSLRWAIRHIRRNHVEAPVIFICTCRIGPYLKLKKRLLRRLHVTLIVNPDGHEWLRAKWSAPIKKYWRYSEKLCIKSADFVVCDSKSIENYIKKEYAAFGPKTTFIAYGSEMERSTLSDTEGAMNEWLLRMQAQPGDYYLNIGRLVPENNYETILKEFMQSRTKHKLIIVTNIKDNKYYEELREKLGFERDERIRFCDAIYDAQLIQKIKDDAFAYIHGHSVGGTNPSLLEALSSVPVNLLYECGFNREVGEDAALYWTLEEGSLAGLLERADVLSPEERSEMERKAQARIREHYAWQQVCADYEDVFLSK